MAWSIILGEFICLCASAVFRPDTPHLHMFPACHKAYLHTHCSHGRSAGLHCTAYLSGCRLVDREVGVRVPIGSSIFTSQYRLDRLLRPIQPSVQCVPGVSSPGVERQGREADHSPPQNTCLYSFIGKHRDNSIIFTFLF
jgi:hypothetical protein